MDDIDPRSAFAAGKEATLAGRAWARYSIWNWMDRVTSILWIDCVPDVIDIWAIRDPNTTFLWHLAR